MSDDLDDRLQGVIPTLLECTGVFISEADNLPGVVLLIGRTTEGWFRMSSWPAADLVAAERLADQARRRQRTRWPGLTATWSGRVRNDDCQSLFRRIADPTIQGV